jgi:acetyl-CoA carboxylase biotin carboxylase subunit
VPGSEGITATEDAALKTAKKLGYPVILKASQGGGGRGMKIVNDKSEMVHAFNVAQREAMTAFGVKDLYVEKYIHDLRHIEVQIMADEKGSVIHLGERDCSVQRRHQKLIEESPAPSVTPRMRRKLGELAVKAAKAIDYRNIGTVEFAVDSDDNIYFMEMNTRVQVEHPVTEAVTGIDIIKEQIRLAVGLPLRYRQSQVKMTGHSIECRINAEDPERFIPSPGTITFFYPPGGPGVRVDTAAFNGWVVPPNYDSLIAKLIVHGLDRQEAIDRMLRALGEFRVEGIKTTIPFHERVLQHERFIKGKVSTSFVDRMNSKES